MVLGDLEVTEDSAVTSGELSHMMLILDQHDRYIVPQYGWITHDDMYLNPAPKYFYWHSRKDMKNGGPYKSFLACLYQAIGPWYGENG